MPHEPLIFVQVALVEGISNNIDDLLDESKSNNNSIKADTAVFYSISNAQRGLDGISFGNFLIKTVVEKLSIETPNLRTFATLSDSWLAYWLNEQIESRQDNLLKQTEKKSS